jgi:beta-galactosidase/beta-glucuronidase
MKDLQSHPRPQLSRARFTSLDGEWEFAFDRDARWREPEEPVFDRRIEVPFAPETKRSGIADPSYTRACWYRRRIVTPPLAPGERLLLHFGAVDWAATVWVNGRRAVDHDGGYTPFHADVTAEARRSASLEIVVRAEDDPHDLAQPRGKQDWKPEPHAIWYPRTTGIWQTVWWEAVPETRIERLRWTPDADRFEIGLAVRVAGPEREGLRLRVRLRAGDRLLADDAWAVQRGDVERRIAIPDPGVDTERGLLLWHPLFPVCFDAELALVGPDGRVLDEVQSYTALRSVRAEGGRILVNGHPETLRLVLDQGYWPESGLTAPSALALRRDVELVRAMGFTGVRKHQKIEDPRWLHCADRLGLFVFEELPSAYRFTPRSVSRLIAEWMRVIERDASHPSIIGWVPMNESWGVPALETDPAQRQLLRALYFLTKSLDPTRLVLGNDGWEMADTDVVGVHDYDTDAGRLARRWSGDRSIHAILDRERPGTRRLLLREPGFLGQPVVLSEVGGIAYAKDAPGTWGYARAESPEALAEWVERILASVHASPHLAGFCWTQLTDTWQEANGLLTAEREPKLPLDRLRRAVWGR